MARLFTAAVFLAMAAVCGAVPQLFGTGQQICNYQYAIPNGGNCVTFGPALEQKLDALQREVGRSQLQQVAENTILSEHGDELNKLKQQLSMSDMQLQDVTKDLKDLQTLVASLPQQPGNSQIPSNSVTMLEQVVRATQTQLTQNMLKLENQLRQDAVQQSQVDQAFQAQLRQQQLDLTSVLQKLQQLDQRVNRLERVTQAPATYPFSTAPHVTTPSTTPSTTTTTTTKTTSATSGVTQSNLQLQQLQHDLQQLKQQLTQLDSDYKTDIPELKQNVTFLSQLAANHSLKLSDIKAQVDYIDGSEIKDLTQKVTTNYNVLTKLNNEFPLLKTQVNGVAGSVSNLGPQINSLGGKLITMMTKQNADEQALTILGQRLDLLQQTFQNSGLVSTAAPGQTTALPTPPHGTAQFSVVPTRRPGSG